MWCSTRLSLLLLRSCLWCLSLDLDRDRRECRLRLLSLSLDLDLDLRGMSPVLIQTSAQVSFQVTSLRKAAILQKP